MEIDLLEPVRLGESTQWIRIRAASARNPLLLLVQMGPGLPMINEVRTFERALSLEDNFTVIYWDQRACGRSLRSAGATRELSVEAMVDDTERLGLPDGGTVTAELRAGEGVRATAAIAAETTQRVLAGAEPGAWTAGQLFGAALVSEATGAQVTVSGEPG